MKIKTSELTGAQLDWAVAKAGREWEQAHKIFPTMTLDPTFSGVRICELGDGTSTCLLIPENPMRQDPQDYCPSTDWRQGGPIIEREKITLIPSEGKGTFAGNPVGGLRWLARCKNMPVNEIGHTPLIAAMRAFVASKMGDEVEVPEVMA